MKHNKIKYWLYSIKFWLYNYDYIIVGLLLLILLSVLITPLIKEASITFWFEFADFQNWLAVIVLLITLLFGFMRQKHNDMSIFFQLFEKYNIRYEELNDYLNAIHRSSEEYEVVKDRRLKPMSRAIDNNNDLSKEIKKELKSEESIKNRLDQYLNLCAEEFSAYHKGYIPPKIMKYWVNGMNIFFTNPHMREYFESELGTNSYYQFEEFAKKQFKLNI